VSNTNLGGWGRGTWNQSAWSTPLSVLVTGVAGTSALGSETATGGATSGVTGLVGTSALGSVLAGTSATISAVGVVGTGSVGIPLVWGDIDTSQVPNWQVVNSS
jgi:hypothetical protein